MPLPLNLQAGCDHLENTVPHGVRMTVRCTLDRVIVIFKNRLIFNVYCKGPVHG